MSVIFVDVFIRHLRTELFYACVQCRIDNTNFGFAGSSD